MVAAVVVGVPAQHVERDAGKQLAKRRIQLFSVLDALGCGGQVIEAWVLRETGLVRSGAALEVERTEAT